MDWINSSKEKTIDFYNKNKIVCNAALIGSLMYLGGKMYGKYKYSQKLFTTEMEINNKCILITGCGHGFGNALALKLSMEYGYKVIAACRTQKSVDEFLSNSSYTANKSTATVLEFTPNSETDIKRIETVKQFVIKYLNDTNCTLWAIVNNAGLGVMGEFELVQPSMDSLIRNVLLTGPINLIRALLPLIDGRKNYQPTKNSKVEYKSDGGRIVNVSSIAARCVIHNTRYGVCKAAISYFSHSLRRELSPLFGVWCCAIEPGGYQTNIINALHGWSDRMVDEIKENKKEELLDIYQRLNADEMKKIIDARVKESFNPNYDEVVDCIVHALCAKYPKREYVPGSSFMFKIMENSPLWLLDNMILKRYKMLKKK